MTEEKKPNKEKQNIMTIYIGLIISMILNFVPIMSAQTFGSLFFLVLLITAYIYRSKSDEDTLQNSHSHYIIKTIWIFSLFLMIGIIFAGLFSDNSALQGLMDNAKNGIMFSEAELDNILSNYLTDNFVVFLITIGPSFLYFIYRLHRGITQANNNELITNLKSWM